jgi:hypothetical protein
MSSNFYRGLKFGIPLSLILWALLVLAINYIISEVT